VTIIPRGRALGITQQLPIDEKHTYPKDYLLKNIAIMMGGRVAEELVLNSQTTGAGNDIERSTEIARKMVCEWGMSEHLGPLTFGKKEEQIFLGREFAQHRDYSEETARLIDNEIRGIVTQSYEKAKDIIQTNMAILHKLANTLLDKEVLDGNQIEAIIKGETV
jgi:cell division protease FtsH